MNILLFDSCSDFYICDKIICLSHFSKAELHMLIQSLKDVQKGNVIVLSEQAYICYKEVRLELRLSNKGLWDISRKRNEFCMQSVSISL